MDFELTGEQQMVRDNVARLMKDRYDFEARKGYRASPAGFSDALWRTMPNWACSARRSRRRTAATEAVPVETMIVMEEFGKALALEPYLETVVLCGSLIARAAAPTQRAELIGRIASGDLRLSFAHVEKQSGFDLHDVGLTARKDGCIHHPRRREESCRERRQRRRAHRLRAGRGRTTGSRRHRAVPRRRGRSRRHASRLSDAGRPARGGNRVFQSPGRTGACARDRRRAHRP